MMVNDLVPAQIDQLEARTWHSYFGRARLKPGATLAQAEAALERVSADIRAQYPTEWEPGRGFVMVPTADVIMHPAVDRILAPAVGLLMGVVGLVLLIACANLASFLLARATDRRKEIAVRLAMGAGRVTLVRQLITETVILSLMGGLAGLGVALGARTWLLNADLPLPLPITMELALDTRVLLFTLGVSLAAGLLFGLVPAAQATNPALASTLRDEGTGGGARKRLTLRNVLVVGQVAASLVLLVGAGLFVRSLQATQSVDPGFAYEPTAMMSIGLPSTRYTPEEGQAFVQTLLDRAREIPGVTNVGVISRLHLDPLNTTTTGLNVDGHEPPPGRSSFSVDQAAIVPATLDALGIELLQGRDFDVTDTGDGFRVAIVNQVMADQFWPEGDAVGRVFLDGDEMEEVVIVGVARTAKVRSLGESPRPQVYWPLTQDYRSFLTVLAKTTGDAQSAALQLFAVARDLDPEAMAFDYKTLERHLAMRLLPAKLSVWLSGIFASLALALACIGLYGVVSYSVAQKTREVGIRMSLGAESGSVVRMLMKQGLGLVAVGGVVGLLGAALFAKLLSSFLFGVDTIDPLTFTVVPVALAGVALLAAYVPARRASRIDPVRALKAE
jgi:putative ABC transport system permease protein